MNNINNIAANSKLIIPKSINMKTKFNFNKGAYIARPKGKKEIKIAETDRLTANKSKGTPFIAYPKNKPADTNAGEENAITLQEGLYIAYPKNENTSERKSVVNLYTPSFFGGTFGVAQQQNGPNLKAYLNDRIQRNNNVFVVNLLQLFRYKVS